MPVALVGIDFGTAVTRSVRWAPGTAWTEQVVAFPSLALARAEGLRVGADALAEAAAQPQAVVCGVKRLLERAPDDEIARSVVARSGASLHVPGTRLHVRTAEDNSMAIDGAIAALLHQAAARAAGTAEGEERVAVIAIPEWYYGPQQGALRRAAQHAGMQVLRFIGDMAAMALWLTKDDDSERTLALVNAGAGGTCVTVVSIDPQGLYISSTVSDRQFGGDDVTASLVDAVLSEAPDSSPAAREVVRQVVESRRAELVAQELIETSARLERPEAQPLDIPVLLERSQLEPALAVARKSIAATCREALDDAELEPDDVDDVYATGGMSVFPPVIEQIAEIFEQEVRHGPGFDEHVVLGAAYEAAILASETEGPLVLDGMSTGRLHVLAGDT